MRHKTTSNKTLSQAQVPLVARASAAINALMATVNAEYLPAMQREAARLRDEGDRAGADYILKYTAFHQRYVRQLYKELREAIRQWSLSYTPESWTAGQVLIEAQRQARNVRTVLGMTA